MIIAVGSQQRICCDNCRRPVGVFALKREDRLMDPRAGYVTGVGKHTGIHICGGGVQRQVIEHPVACSDTCEDRLLQTWPRTRAEDVHSGDWEEDFRDADVRRGKKR